MGKYTNLMDNRLDVEKVSQALEEGGGGTQEAIAEINALIGATPLKQGYTITSELEEHEEKLANAGGYTEEILFEGSTNDSITLSKSFKDYDLIAVNIGSGSGVKETGDCIFLVSNYDIGDRLLVSGRYGTRYIVYTLESYTSLKKETANDITIYKIIGIKFGA